ncbi:MAG: hypothetical protein L0206_08040 [Actinobacteria bacterium]|nr:hypothetical protein [Actinomycetota bacterium]
MTAATLLMMAWAILPGAAAAAPSPVPVPGNPQCSDFGLLLASGTVTITGDEEQGTQQVAWSSSTPIDAVIVKGGNQANVYFYDEATSDSGLTAPINPNTLKPFGVSHVDLCFDEDPPTTTTKPPTTTTEPPTTTTKPPTTTTPPPTTTTPPPTTTTPPPTTTTPPPTTTEPPTTTTEPPTTTTEPPTVSPTTIEPTVDPTTTQPPGGTAFTGVQNVVPLGAIALILLTTGSGLMWAGSRRRRSE